MFKILKKSQKSKARLTELTTAHGKISGPFFIPIASKGAVKNLTPEEIKELDTQIILSNTYHLMISPGIKVIKKAGGLHRFINWFGPILTDSGGFQVFSLAKIRKITSKGVLFSEPKSGRKYFLTPEKSIQIQLALGSDIIMALDECTPYPCSKKYAKESLELTTRWAKKSKMSYKLPFDFAQGRPFDFAQGRPFDFAQGRPFDFAQGRQVTGYKRLLFGIIQGSIYKDLRLQSLKEITEIGFNGYAIGGVAVGEPRKKMKEILKWIAPKLPEDKPRYLMGIGKPEEIILAVKYGIDMFDCVIPTREARHGRLYLWKSPSPDRWSPSPLGRGGRGEGFYTTINITNAKFAKNLSPINQNNLKQYSKTYLHHLFRTNEPLGMRLATLNNLKFYLDLMRKIRLYIKEGRL